MPSNLVPPPSQAQLKQLHKLLKLYAAHIWGDQPLAADIIRVVLTWIQDDIEG